ncbi:OLC1v1001810C1 [Oldenlandia corymbosa var. corymbosa]|uniref:OLC1v1001810C1 n=1 Tax=Oldenlandia corymbosa var. corymbosa TaxID=529605 RepID=A0AAV1D9K6_OLDCO|nr:OLC1v1001810C1 [Oldenlandia corymbosa var. corymbosa]
MANQGGNLKSTVINGVKMYTVTGQQRSLATWIPTKKLKALRKDKKYMQRLELIQDLRFETATSRIKVTSDGDYVIASGIYPPQVKVYELRELSLKFERHLVSEIVNFEVLSDDYSKIAFLCADRSVSLHAKYGSHYSLRIPRMGRDLAYDCWSCDLLCAASSPDLYRINLEQGRFLSPLSTQSEALNVVTRSKVHGLVACGGEDGFVECFDVRARSSVGRIDAVSPAGDVYDQEVTALQFDEDGGYLMGVGSSSGKVLIYDLRSSVPLRVKDHMYGNPILSIKWHKTLNSGTTKLITADKHIVRIWDPETGEGMTSIEPTAGNINDLCVFKGSGLMLLALDNSQIPSYFVPALGPAPKWCSHLDNLTEELEENPETTIYDDFKFLTKEDLEKLNLTSLVGSNCLRAYMHGYFIDYRLYKRVLGWSNSLDRKDYIEKLKQEKLEKERESRITIRRKLPKVNRVLASKLLLEEAENEKKDAEGADDVKNKASKKKKGLTAEIMNDDRFSKLFTDQDYEIDMNSPEFLALHPVASTTEQSSLIGEHFELVGEDEENTDSDASSEAEDGLGGGSKSRVPKLYEAIDERHAEAFSKSISLAKEDALPIGEKVAAMTKENVSNSNGIKVGAGGSREISFISRSKAKYSEYDDDDRDGLPQKRRGIQDLKLKPDKSSFRGSFGRGGNRGRGRGGRARGRGRGRGHQ